MHGLSESSVAESLKILQAHDETMNFAIENFDQTYTRYKSMLG